MMKTTLKEVNVYKAVVYRDLYPLLCGPGRRSCSPEHMWDAYRRALDGAMRRGFSDGDQDGGEASPDSGPVKLVMKKGKRVVSWREFADCFVIVEESQECL
ncbi:MAG: hypothetical protein ACE5FM_00030 [Methyloligellaceae bacterium]